jgi:DNA-binding XRE family transcriptional regulator
VQRIGRGCAFFCLMMLEVSYTLKCSYVYHLWLSKSREPTGYRRDLGLRIKALREKRGWTQTDLSIHSGVDRSHLSEIENGRRDMTMGTLQALAGALDLTVAKLINGLL